jgi:transposase
MLWQRGKSYSQDLRERVFAAADDGEPVGQIARLLRVSVSYVSKVLSRRQRTGQTQGLPQRGHVPPKLTDLHGAIETQVTARPDATIEELRAWLPKTHQVSASTGLMWKTLAALGLTLKSPSSGRAKTSGRRQGAHRMARGTATSVAMACGRPVTPSRSAGRLQVHGRAAQVDGRAGEVQPRPVDTDPGRAAWHRRRRARAAA